MSQSYDVIIVGAGLVGSVLALALASRTDLKIAVLERAPSLRSNDSPNQRVVALGSLATSMLDQLGVLQELVPGFCHAYHRMFIWDENSDGELGFSAAEQQHKFLGHMIDSVQCTLVLQKKLLAASAVDTFFETELHNLRFDSEGGLLCSADQTWYATLIVAADGGNSWVRQQARIFANHQSYNQLGIVARIKTSEPHQDTAWQRFLGTGSIAVLPVLGNQSSIVWSAQDQYAHTLMSLSDDDFGVALQAALQNKLGCVSLCSKRTVYPLKSQKAVRYFKRNLVLVGDAAHSIHPLAGQGANLGFKDVQTLVNLLAEADKSHVGSPLLLQRYQRLRKSDNEQTDLMMSALCHAYQSSDPLWLAARGLGMNVLSRSAFIKGLLVRQAMGL